MNAKHIPSGESQSVTESPVSLPESHTTTALALVTRSITELNEVAATVVALEERYKGVVFDVKTTAGMKAACEARLNIRKPRYTIQKMQKDAKTPLNELKKSIDEQVDAVIERIAAVEQPIHEQIVNQEKRKEEEKQAKAEAERQRVTTIRERIDEIRQRPADAIGQSAVEIELYVTALTTLEIDDSFSEFQKEAEGAKETALIRLRSTHAKAVAHEEQQRQLAEERERLASEREEQERLQAAERARIAEQERQARVAREEQEKRAREAREAEDRRLAEQRRRQEAELQTQRERMAEQERVAAAGLKAEQDRLAAERRRQQEEADCLEIQRVEAQKANQARREAIEAEERRIAADRAQLEREREEQRMREAGGGVPAGTTASESSDSNIANATTEPGTESIASSTSEPEATSLQANYAYIVFDGPPAATSGRFVEVEDEAGKSISIGEWIERPDGLWALRIERNELRLTPSAWMRGVVSPGGPWGPAEYDHELVAGDDQPEGDGWIPLYRKLGVA